MIQDIYPSKLKNEYIHCEMQEGDKLLVFDKKGRMMVSEQDGKLVFPSASDVRDPHAVYCFSLDDEKYFLTLDAEAVQKEGFSFYDTREIRDISSNKEAFIAFTAWHLWRWYADNIYCGRCAEKLEFDKKERALRCPKCNNVIYPRINPAVIVGVIKGDCLLITKYRSGYGHSALVAGFTEIGETFEETVQREVMEETGVKVKNIRYYKSQPWGIAQDILAGYFCEADGDGIIHRDNNELKYAEWVKREDIVLQPNNLSLTNEMMSIFKEGK